MTEIPNDVAEREFSDSPNDRSPVKREYGNLRSVVVREFDERVWIMLDSCISVIAALMLEDLPNPIGLN